MEILDTQEKCYLLDSFNHNWNNCLFPRNRSEVIMSPIYKKGDAKKPENYRPISLLNTGMKLFPIMLSNRLNVWCEQRSKISDFQAAYRKTYGCEDHGFVLNSTIQYNVSRRRK
jgi:hypothetical protein